jgi:hypothetical protein
MRQGLIGRKGKVYDPGCSSFSAGLALIKGGLCLRWNVEQEATSMPLACESGPSTVGGGRPAD